MLEKFDSEIYSLIEKEMVRESETINLIASENYASSAVLSATGSILTNKYAEGYPSRRYYGGCEFIDSIESIAIARAEKLFNAEHVNVQPHSGSQANMAVYLSCAKPADTILGMDICSGGHLSHGAKVSFSGTIFNAVYYGVNQDTHLIDYSEVENIAQKYKPKIIICGASAYPRIIDFKRFSEIAKNVNAYLCSDMAHIAGLVAAGIHPSPVDVSDFVTSTTHKTLRGPRGGFIICKKEHARKIDKTIFPGMQGGPLMHVIAAKAVVFKEAATDDFKEYQNQIVKNAILFAETLKESGYHLITGGTDNHMLLIDLRNKKITGLECQNILEKINIIVNKNSIPFDPLGATVTSGIRIGTPAITSRGIKEKEILKIIEFINEALYCKDSPEKLKNIRDRVKDFIKQFPIYK
ncbi:MAG: serine hydroxymethyltransferase [Candidatus Omnitrophica bacterium]|jgi:glycine hydroxymethyltransferase|nr:serine hydroxymethyltransferase [Candidatus Omnitrophota bacterium]